MGDLNFEEAWKKHLKDNGIVLTKETYNTISDEELGKLVIMRIEFVEKYRNNINR